MLLKQIKLCQTLLDKCQPNKSSNYLYLRLFEAQLNQIIRKTFVDEFWLKFSKDLDKSSNELHWPLILAIQSLSDLCNKVENILDVPKRRNLKEQFFSTLKIQILAQKPYYLNEYLTATYTRGFRCYLNLDKVRDRENSMDVDQGSAGQGNDDDDTEVFHAGNAGNGQNSCPGCSQIVDDCECGTTYEKFCLMNQKLRHLDLLESLVGDTVLTVARMFIVRKVSSKGKSNYSCSYLDELNTWTQSVVKKWVAEIYGYTESEDEERLSSKLYVFLKEAYAEVRVSHMFEIIIEYPSSEAAIQDLKLCLDESTSSSFRLDLIESVKQSLIESLLHPGVNTYDILTAYISAIKALRALDPTGLILQLVTEPVRRYLKLRDDTVRCIVTALTDEDHNSELNREMIRSGTQTNENGVYEKNGNIEMSLPDEGEKCTVANFEKWKPDPIKLSSSDEIMKSSRFSDIVSILVNIYETKDLFVEEYQKLLSQRLLNKHDECNLDTELRNLELLTLRFSDCELHRCEVMLKDVQTSKRINKRILSGDIREHKLEDFKNLDVLIVSSPFWPEKFGPMASISDETPKIEFAPEIQSAIDTYTKAFEAIQASRTLHWRHHLGSVNIDLTIDNKTRNFTVSPLHVSLLYLFKDKLTWTLSELIHKTSLPGATIRSRLALWVRNSVIGNPTEDTYYLNQ